MMHKILIQLALVSFLLTSEYPIEAPFDNQSIITYEGSHPAHNWEGESRSFKGGIVCDNLEDCIIKIQIPLESFDSGSSGRDSNMLYYTESNKYPYVTFYSNSFTLHNDIFTLGSNISLNGTLEFHGVKQEVKMTIFIYNNNQFLFGETQFDILLSDYNVERPSLLFVPISDRIVIKCNLSCFIAPFNFKNEK